MKNIIKKNKNLKWYLISALTSIIFSLVLFSFWFKNDNIFTDYKIANAIDRVSNLKNMNKEKLNEVIIDGLFYHINKTDIHSNYFNKQEFKEFSQDLNGTLVGIGVSTIQNQNSLVIKRVFKDTPAYISNLQEGDEIIGTNDVLFSNLKNKQQSFVNFVKGEENTKVKLIIKRGQGIFNIWVTRKSLVIPQVYSRIIKNNLYVQISSFGENIFDQFYNELNKYKIDSYNKIIIDLRNNGGGDLDEVEKIISLFVKSNTNILIRKKHGEVIKDKSINLGNKFLNKNIAILINENSASASEILTISLKELKGARIYGAKSYGKGSVQQLVPLRDGSAFKYTIEKWFSPGNIGIDHKGIKPDVLVNNSKEWQNSEFSKSFEIDYVLNKAIGDANNGK